MVLIGARHLWVVRVFFYICCISLIGSLFAQTASTGTVTDSVSGEALHGAHIINLSSKKFAISDPDGKFSIPTQPGDTLRISYIGYESAEIIITEKTQLTIKLPPAATLLDEVQVSIFPEYHHFKQLILDTEPVDSTMSFGFSGIPLDAYPVPVNEQNVRPPDYHAPSVGVSFDLGGFSKAGKEKKKMEKILARRELERIGYQKFNRQWVAEQTQLEGDELTDFIAFCKFTPKYLAKTSLFDINERMMVLLKEFQSEKDQADDNRYTPGA